MQVSHNKPMQRAGTDKLLGRGRLIAVHEQVTSAHVLNRQRAVADGCRYAPPSRSVLGIIALALILLPRIGVPAQADALAPVRFMLGSWAGAASGQKHEG
jgi:hypothetical protein